MATVVLHHGGWKEGGMPLGVIDVDQSAPVNKPEYAGVHAYVKSNVKAPSFAESNDKYVHEYTCVYSAAPVVAPTPPTERQRRVVKDKALAYVNVARTALGCRPLFDLPSGQVGNAADCVIARAIPGAMRVGGTITFDSTRTAKIVGHAWGVAGGKGGTIGTPDALCMFINAFDHGCYPELAL